LGNGVGDQYRKKSTILGDSEILRWQEEQRDICRARQRKQKERIINNIPEDVKSKRFSGVEKEQLLRGMTILEIYKRRMRRK